ncbi:hypothetical protein CRI77_22105 [Mycolicibacterium duvalii]|uniref:Uncharacterized protein n=1 Tax=Mycolicibacterium duvalii TaxID=39688 RepID=A0A7I7K1F1_9MYCO|nr:hypothetical protein [Mycolicibacterium duvalii]MCV7370659.1 hypothetical protein [Mycolicibacterium duvalii]PEG36861.1 hypothetical protein CRI77_22105 [Mycolicibacterium duvalii]BBX17956.1 hypothetical protein MDUV_28160 [Mycolicibacterium duvalii]
MDSTITAVAVVIVLAVWHAHNRRHPGWRASSDGRFNIYCGYALVAIATYWLHTAPTATGWEWAVGNLWALGAMLAFVTGFGALNRVTAEHALSAQLLESLEGSTTNL